MPHTALYDLLGVRPSCTDRELRQAYRQQALKWHPDKHPDPADKAAAERRFQKIAAAYELLHNPEKRRLYDAYGEGLGTGDPSPGGRRPAAGPHGASNGANGAFYSDQGFASFFGPAPPGPQYKADPIHADVPCTLHDLFAGTTKTVSVRRQVAVSDFLMADEVVDFDVHVRPGWRAGTRCVWEGHGHHWLGTSPGDVVFTIRELKHPTLRRKGDDLYCSVPVGPTGRCRRSLVTLLDGFDVLVCDGTEPMLPGTDRIFAGKGMPTPRTGERGDLIVEFRFLPWLPGSRWFCTIVNHPTTGALLARLLAAKAGAARGMRRAAVASLAAAPVALGAVALALALRATAPPPKRPVPAGCPRIVTDVLPLLLQPPSSPSHHYSPPFLLPLDLP
jgi:DnaJ family protein B protein 4